jgi:hypothetical protein
LFFATSKYEVWPSVARTARVKASETRVSFL